MKFDKKEVTVLLYAYFLEHPYVLLCIVIAMAMALVFIIRLIRSKRTTDRVLSETKRKLEETEAVLTELRISSEFEKSMLISEMSQMKKKIAHGFRTPIAVIIGYADLIASESHETIKVTDCADKIHARASYMSEFLNEILSLKSVSKDRIDILEALRQLTDEMKLLAAKKDVHLHVISSERHVFCDVDLTMMTDVFFNIIENSLKYMGRPGNVFITVGKTDTAVSISFRDDGFGLSGDETENIFKDTWQRQRSGEKSGYGFGLFSVKCAVEAHGGSVSASSSVGGGMSVNITLNIVTEQ
ncbi:hypothetical protein FACS1894111_06590 [Clostridia bacterium]|nr:hypothetical protein FACS1894111_06590 [Clostridia bacterium]